MRALAAAALSALVAGCGGSDGNFHLTLTRSPIVAEDPLAGVDTIELRLSERDGTTEVRKLPVASRAATSLVARLPPFGDGTRLTVAALAGGRVVAAGHSPPLVANAHAATVYLGLVNQFSATPTAPPLGDARFDASTTLLADGRVLIVGGATRGAPRSPDPSSLSDAVTIYDPVSGRFSDVGGGSFQPRIFSGVVATPDGGALIAGGLGSFGGGFDNLFRFDPAGTLTPLSGLAGPRFAAAAVALADGSLLLVGGYGASTSAPATDALIIKDDSATSIALPAPRAFASAAMLAGGDVLVTGGLDGNGNPLDDAIVYSGGAFVALAPTGDARATMLAARVGHSTTLLGDGAILVYGGSDGNGSLALPELYRPELGGFITVGPFDLQPRERHDAVALADGSVLLFGGEAAPPPNGTPLPVQQLLRAVPRAGSVDLLLDFPATPLRADAAGLLLADGSIFYAEGAVGEARTLAGGAQLLVPCFDDCLLPSP